MKYPSPKSTNRTKYPSLTRRMANSNSRVTKNDSLKFGRNRQLLLRSLKELSRGAIVIYWSSGGPKRLSGVLDAVDYWTAVHTWDSWQPVRRDRDRGCPLKTVLVFIISDKEASLQRARMS